ncbi:hypothetical protein C8Q80DRAFT_1095647 [Daedaleopsis nitida]|nr:hypothetical protein C8Q80DRAFT_1095647 [Daedaleopsis nitida]
MPTLGAYSQASLTKLTVAQLKTLCKDRKIAGYSKLAKQALVQKLVDSGLCSDAHSEALDATPRKYTSTVTAGTPSVAQAPSPVCDRPYADLPTRPSTTNAQLPQTDHLSVSTVTNSAILLTPTTPAPSFQSARASLYMRPSGARKRSARPSIDSMPPPPAKKLRILSAPPTPDVQATTISMLSPPRATAQVSDRAIASVKICSPSLPTQHFKPLKVNKAKLSAFHVVPVSASDSKASSAHETSLAALDQWVSAAPKLNSITMPPSLAQRKRVNGWAVILSGLSDQERAVCALVSRAFRYAVYLSASTALLRDYCGRRLQEDVLRKYPQAMTNMWPYLRLREAEATQRRRVYDASFLARLLRCCGWPEPIVKRLWGSPDHPKQLLIALRSAFALTRACFTLSVGSPQPWQNSTVLDVQEVVAGEIWSVLVDRPSSSTLPRGTEMLYVLEETCEVVGRPAPGLEHSGEEDLPLHSQNAPGPPMRADWAMYMARRGAPGSTESPLLSRLRCACEEDFDRGVSRLWLRKASAEGAVGDAKRAVAERYVLACVMANSISGQWKTMAEMAQEFAGLPERVAPPTRTKDPNLNLYLPEHHHVESVHFMSPRGDALHAAVAVVQTPHREYFILRDNGMQIGCEEEGVASVWQEVLRCDHRGIPGGATVACT